MPIAVIHLTFQEATTDLGRHARLPGESKKDVFGVNLATLFPALSTTLGFATSQGVIYDAIDSAIKRDRKSTLEGSRRNHVDQLSVTHWAFGNNRPYGRYCLHRGYDARL
jgi:hypothetical protein